MAEGIEEEQSDGVLKSQCLKYMLGKCRNPPSKSEEFVSD